VINLSRASVSKDFKIPFLVFSPPHRVYWRPPPPKPTPPTSNVFFPRFPPRVILPFLLPPPFTYGLTLSGAFSFYPQFSNPSLDRRTLLACLTQVSYLPLFDFLCPPSLALFPNKPFFILGPPGNLSPFSLSPPSERVFPFQPAPTTSCSPACRVSPPTVFPVFLSKFFFFYVFQRFRCFRHF